MSYGTYKLIPETFTPIPSSSLENTVAVLVANEIPAGIDAIGYVVGTDEEPPGAVDRETLSRSGFDASAGSFIAIPQRIGPVIIIVGAGSPESQDSGTLRDVAAMFARAAARFPRIGLNLGSAFAGVGPEEVGALVAEGVLLARYRYTALRPSSKSIALVSLDIIVDRGVITEVARGVERGMITARATNLARDLANTPPSHLTAADLGRVCIALAEEHGLSAEVFDKSQIIAMGCGGLLGVNAGSVEEPRIIKISYTPAAPQDGPRPLLCLVGKGIMYDSGGISLKPSDPMHLAMKMDMAGAAAIIGAMTVLNDRECPLAVTAFLMCTDNMPSGSAMKLGDVLTIRGGTTVEVKNSDAEGRLVMSDALVLATEESPNAIVDIATLTGAAMMALGTHTAAILGNNQALIDQAMAASHATDESLWQLPLEHRYRPQLNSHIADISNMAGKYAGATTAALFLAEFVGDIPWAHLDIAGTMQSEQDDSWRTEGATGFGTRLLIDLALHLDVSALLPVSTAPSIPSP